MKPVIKSEFRFWGRNAKVLAKYLRPVPGVKALDLWQSPDGFCFLRTMRAVGGKWQLHSFTLLPDWRIDGDLKRRRERGKAFAALLKRTRQ